MKCTYTAIACSLVGILFTPFMNATVSAQTAAATPYDVLVAQEGTWNTRVEVLASANHPARSYNSVTTNEIGCNGKCLVSTFSGESAPGVSFSGSGISTYDPGTKKYVESWTDATGNGISTSEYVYNASTRTFTGSMDTRTAGGRTVRMVTAGQFTDANNRTMTMSTVGADGNLSRVIVCAMARASSSSTR